MVREHVKGLVSRAEKVREEIEAETKRLLAKTGQMVSPEPIQLTVHSPDVPNLTLVDMPGLTKIAIDGQPESIVQVSVA